jgi:FAD/FMN-containing dehydrogenase
MTTIVTALGELLGPDQVLTGAAVGARARHAWSAEPLEALALVRPRSTEEVSAVLRLCHELGQPVVAHGGRTGLAGGERATAGDVVLSLERMNAIESIDADGRTVTVQAGCLLQALQEAVEAADLYFPLDLGARGSCTIGGNIATNAGGVTVIRYGMMRSLVLGLEAVLADGTVISSMNRMLKNNSGYDLKQLFIGTEGTLGIVTRAVLMLKERPTSLSTALVAVDDVAHLAGLLRHMDRALGGQLSSFEVMWGDYYRAVTAPGGHAAPLERDHPFYAVIESQGFVVEADAARFEAAVAAAWEAGLVADAVLPKSRAERDRVWAIREDFGLIRQDQPLFAYDVSLPIGDMPAYVAEVDARVRARWPQGRFHAFGHLGDGNLHFVVCPREQAEDLHEAVDRAVYEPLLHYGGAVSAEHGIGFDKKRWLGLSRGPAEIELMRLLKRSLDPRNILNPGKVLPDCGAGVTMDRADGSPLG